jgi:integrating conjugative element protein (TIGR03765 family)
MCDLLSSFGRLCRLSGLGAAVLLCAKGFAGVTTIHEGGPTLPIGEYLIGLRIPEPTTRPGAGPVQAPSLPMAFPITTPSMRPGALQMPMRLRTAGGLFTPLFIVGDDPGSKQWLLANREALHRFGATGLVVNVASLDAFRSLRAVAPDVAMAPGSIETLARQSGLAVYPLFVATDGRVSQQVPR